jgi:hypothetical protein
MLDRTTSIRKSLAAFATVGSLLVGVASSYGQGLKPMLGPSSDGITETTNCKDWKPGELMASEKCEILKGRLLKVQGNGLATQNGCIDELVKYKRAEPDAFKSLGFGTITRDNACNLASRLPKKAASLQ